jgi:hypothetical protein
MSSKQIYESELIEKVETFCINNDMAEYTFGHIVLADYNISEDFIFNCFSMKTIRTWISQELADNTDGHIFIDKMRLYIKVADFLDELRELLMNHDIIWDDD